MEPITDGAMLSPWEPGVFSLFLFGLLVLAFIGFQLFIAHWLGEKKESREKSRVYESGVIPTGKARLQFPVPFYMVAIFFLLFDVEGVFIFAWAVVFRDLGWTGWFQMAFFIIVLFVGLAYIWVKGGLDWRESHRPK